MPRPEYEEREEFGSPVPSQSVSGACGSMAMSPDTIVGSPSDSGLKVTPLLLVFHTPPEA
jgi:hypothetical protein